MDNKALSKELVGVEQRNIVAQTAHEELLVAISEVKRPRIRENYENCLIQLASNHFDITEAELKTLSPDKRKVLEEFILKKAREDWKKDRIVAKSFFSVATVGILISSLLAYLIDPIFLLGLFSFFIYIPGLIRSDGSENKKFLDAYEKFNGGAENE